MCRRHGRARPLSKLSVIMHLQGWDLGAVRRVAGRLVERGSGQCNWLDGGDEHPHRIALSVQVDALGHVQGEMARGLQEAGVEAQVRLARKLRAVWMPPDSAMGLAGTEGRKACPGAAMCSAGCSSPDGPRRLSMPRS